MFIFLFIEFGFSDEANGFEIVVLSYMSYKERKKKKWVLEGNEVWFLSNFFIVYRCMGPDLMLYFSNFQPRTVVSIIAQMVLMYWWWVPNFNINR